MVKPGQNYGFPGHQEKVSINGQKYGAFYARTGIVGRLVEVSVNAGDLL